MSENWPEAVLERIEPYAKRLEKTLDEALGEFSKWLLDEFQVTAPLEEDEFYLGQWAEQFVTETRNLGTGGGGSGPDTETYVGSIICIDENINDLRAKQRRTALSLYGQNSNRAIEEGQIGIVTSKDGVWHVNGEPTRERVDGDKLPWFAIEHDDRILCLLNTFQASDSYGKPIAPTSEVRTLYLLGNKESEFENNVSIWRISVSGDAMRHDYELGQPCRVQARAPKTTKQGNEDSLYGNRDFHKTLVYTDDFVNEYMRKELHPDRLLINTQVHNEYVHLEDLDDEYESRKRRNYNGDGYYCPIILTKGYVSRMNKEPRASEWDKTGRNFSLSITSVGLQARHGRDTNMSEVPVWINGTLYDEGHPFEFKNGNGEWQPYAERTQVIIAGRIKVKIGNDDKKMYSINALGIYVPSMTARPAAGGGDTSLSQFGGDE